MPACVTIFTIFFRFRNKMPSIWKIFKFMIQYISIRINQLIFIWYKRNRNYSPLPGDVKTDITSDSTIPPTPPEISKIDRGGVEPLSTESNAEIEVMSEKNDGEGKRNIYDLNI